MTIRLGALAAFFLAAACGSSSIDDKQLHELSSSEIRELCDYVVALDADNAGAACGRVDEPGEELAECIGELSAFPSTCRVTVERAKECFEHQAAHPCDDPDNAPQCQIFCDDDD
jgi:hypothetical protein